MQEAWRRFVPVGWLIAMLVGASLAGAIYVLVTEDDSPWVDVAITAFDAVVIMLFVWREWRPIAEALQVRQISSRQWLGAGLVLLCLGGFVELYFYAAHWLFEVAPALDGFREHGWSKWSAVLLVCVCPAVFEELAFRGFLLARLVPLMGQRDALLVQATLFSLVHLSPTIFISHFVMGLGLGVMRLRTASLIPGMLAHGAWNGYVLLQEGLLAPW